MITGLQAQLGCDISMDSVSTFTVFCFFVFVF